MHIRRTQRLGASLALAIAAAGCVTTERVSYFNSGELDVVQVLPVRSWTVVAEGEAEPLGQVVLLRSRDESGRQFFRVSNRGMVDALGRAWRYRPHREEAEWLGTGTVAEGALSILDAPEGTRLVEVPAVGPDGSEEPAR
jgi:hypothetical protein